MRTIAITTPGMITTSDNDEDASSVGTIVDQQEVMSVPSSPEGPPPELYNAGEPEVKVVQGSPLDTKGLTADPFPSDVKEPAVQRNASAEADAEWMREVAASNAAAQYESALEAAAAEAAANADAAAAVDAAANAEEVAAEAAVAEVNDAAHALLRDDLEDYLRRRGDAASFEGWIGQLHPENVDADGWIDMRLCLEGSEYRQLWAAATSPEAVRRRGAAATAAAAAAGGAPPPLVDAAVGLTGHVFSGMAAGTSLGFAAMHGALGCGVDGVKKAKGCAAKRGAAPLHAALRVAQASLELADLCALGAEHVAARGLAAAGGATCGLMARDCGRAAEAHQCVRATHERLRWRHGPGEGVLRASGVPVGCGA